MRTIRYREIAEQLRSRLAAGEFVAGGVLPSEAELSSTYSASRVTIRRALELLREEGLVDSRQGFGWFVAADPLRQSLAQLGTIEDQLAASGVDSERRILGFAFVSAPGWVQEVLDCEEVLEVRRCNLADGQPFARVTVWCPAALGADLSRADVERTSFIDLLDVDVGGARQVIGAAAASTDDAELLKIPEGSPVLRAERVTHDAQGTPVLVAEHVFAAHSTEFVVELPAAATSSSTGLRLLG